MSVCVGLDLGALNDFSAIAVVQAEHPDWDSEERPGARDLQPILRLAQLDRIREVPYPDIARRLAKNFRNSPTLRHAELVVDATGVGLPVTQLLTEAGFAPVCVTITGGDKAHFEKGRGWRVPKRDLIQSLQVLLQSGHFEYGTSIPLIGEATKEILAYSYKIDPKTAHDSYAADTRLAPHDDLVLAIALAVWRLRQTPPESWEPYHGGERRGGSDVGRRADID